MEREEKLVERGSKGDTSTIAKDEIAAAYGRGYGTASDWYQSKLQLAEKKRREAEAEVEHLRAELESVTRMSVVMEARRRYIELCHAVEYNGGATRYGDFDHAKALAQAASLVREIYERNRREREGPEVEQSHPIKPGK